MAPYASALSGQREVEEMAEAERSPPQLDQRALVGAVHQKPGIPLTERAATAALGSVERTAARVHHRPTTDSRA